MPNSPRIPRKAKPRAPSTALGSETDQLLRVIAETAADAIITIDERSIILFANPAAERIFGYRISEMLGQEVTTLMPTYLREVHRAALRRYLETGQKHTAWSALDLTGLHKSGREIPLEISLSDHAHDGKRTFTGIVRDLSDRVRADTELRQSEEKYARMIQSSPDAITLRTLPDCRYLEVNPGFTRLTTVASPSDASVEDRTSRQTAIDCGRSFARRARPASIPGSVPAEKPASERPAKGS